jgi:uncharacterized membrane protein
MITEYGSLSGTAGIAEATETVEGRGFPPAGPLAPFAFGLLVPQQPACLASRLRLSIIQPIMLRGRNDMAAQSEDERHGWARLSTFDLAVAGVFGALAIVLAFTPLGLIPVPNPTEAATSLHLPAIVAGILAGPVVGGLVGLVLAISSWALYNAAFLTFAGGNLAVALAAAFLPRLLIGVCAYYVYRPLRRLPAVAGIVAGLVGTLTNTVGVLGILIALGTLPVALLVPVFSMNVPIEVALALVVVLPTVAALRAVARGRIAAERD